VLSFCRSLMKALKEVADKGSGAVRNQDTVVAVVVLLVDTGLLDCTAAVQVLDKVRNGVLFECWAAVEDNLQVLVVRRVRPVVLELRNLDRALAVLHKRAAAVKKYI